MKTFSQLVDDGVQLLNAEYNGASPTRERIVRLARKLIQDDNRVEGFDEPSKIMVDTLVEAIEAEIDYNERLRLAEGFSEEQP